MNWYKLQEFVEHKLEGVIVLFALPVMIVVLLWEWLIFELTLKIKRKVASLFK